MAHRNFDDESEAQPQPGEPLTFELCGREWHVDELPDRLKLKWASLSTTGEHAGMIDLFLDYVVIPEERDEFHDCTLDGRVVQEPKVDGSGAPVIDEETGVQVIEQRRLPKPKMAVLAKIITWALKSQTAAAKAAAGNGAQTPAAQTAAQAAASQPGKESEETPET